MGWSQSSCPAGRFDQRGCTDRDSHLHEPHRGSENQRRKFFKYQSGQKASVRFLGYGNWLYEATVTKILPTADPETQRYIVHLDVKIEPEKLIPGITGEVLIIVGERPSPANIPRRALFNNTKVYAVENGRVRLRTIKPGYLSNTFVEVLEGLKPGDMVIVDQLDQFRDGDRVRTELVGGK